MHDLIPAALIGALILFACLARVAFRQPVGNPDGTAEARHIWAQSNLLGHGMLAAGFVAVILVFALAFGAPAHAEAPPAPPAAEARAGPTLADALAICRLAEARSPEAKSRYEALPEAARPAVMLVCLGYHQALRDSAPPPLPAGTSI